ncbi:aminotransferase class I/II-fold pyridoxal phosphate-dependent enzyme [Metabacillus fastidiosus]|uniref:aminotransferase class I/II-fold pyridoxal phosphate-dependent enzyme n=1 Tax=Metabacillus fastidiosus TaxID=1458 RepID=UPI002E1BB26B|nr:aminotransferase class I/II-fold pyridoxal phosphate-dependent enzyme [Metabacillus fastidiosus]MED4455600.1 aminotransferase class I/II-fold pyridoxal phosphate-dependent enzyme [Metabacillus fastidiosus]
METPLFSALIKHKSRYPVSYHVPGHKNGEVFINEAREVFQEILKIDVTELNSLDDLHDPQEAIAEAQSLAAALYEVDKTFFLVNGSTVGNLAMIMACCSEGEPVLVQRNSHKSIMHGVQLAGAKPVFLSPVFDEQYKVPAYVEYETVKEAILQFPNAKALILTNPNYYGLSTDLTEIINLAHQYKIPVLVDEAHGAHFVLGKGFPVSSVKYGADVVVHSAHKTLPAMTMGSFLHVNSNLVDIDKVTWYLSILQSSSPSYPIMASLDLARAYLEECKQSMQEEIIQAVNKFKEQIGSLSGIKLITSKDKNIKTDPLKVTIQSTNGLTGFELQSIFETTGVYCELADIYNLLFVLPLKDIDLLSEKLTLLESLLRNKKGLNNYHCYTYQADRKIISLEIPYSHFKNCKKEVVNFADAVGHYAAESIIPYPPGIPFIMAGEKLTEKLIEELINLINLGINIQGDQHISYGEIAVYRK